MPGSASGCARSGAVRNSEGAARRVRVRPGARVRVQMRQIRRREYAGSASAGTGSEGAGSKDAGPFSYRAECAGSASGGTGSEGAGSKGAGFRGAGCPDPRPEATVLEAPVPEASGLEAPGPKAPGFAPVSKASCPEAAGAPGRLEAQVRNMDCKILFLLKNQKI